VTRNALAVPGDQLLTAARIELIMPKKLVIVSMRAYPEPHNIVFLLNGECPPMKTNPNGSEATYLFEMQRWMPRILSQERIGFVRQSLHVLGELAVEKPETWCCPVSQKSVQRPSRKSCNASSPSRSSRPEATSVSSC